MLAAIKVNQWKNTSSTFEWFKNIDRKETCLFSKFDTESFYHSISVRIINKATDSRKKFVFFSNDDIFIIIKTRKTLVFHEQAPWIEKTGNKNFDVPMGWFDGEEVCKLLSSYILRKLKVIMKKKNIGPYWDNDFGFFCTLSGPEAGRKWKRILELLKQCELPITVEINLKTRYPRHFFDLTYGTFRAYRKPNDSFVSINFSLIHELRCESLNTFKRYMSTVEFSCLLELSSKMFVVVTAL